MYEEGKDNQVHVVSFGKGESFSHEAAQPLAQSAVEALDVVGARFGVALGELLSCEAAMTLEYASQMSAKQWAFL